MLKNGNVPVGLTVIVGRLQVQVQAGHAMLTRSDLHSQFVWKVLKICIRKEVGSIHAGNDAGHKVEPCRPENGVGDEILAEVIRVNDVQRALRRVNDHLASLDAVRAQGHGRRRVKDLHGLPLEFYVNRIGSVDLRMSACPVGRLDNLRLFHRGWHTGKRTSG